MIFQDPMTSLNPTMKIGKQVMEFPIFIVGFNDVIGSWKIIEMSFPRNLINSCSDFLEPKRSLSYSKETLDVLKKVKLIF
jgi:ABC-type dipeptide/oligopeptide/nickel transport system ATPase component